VEFSDKRVREVMTARPDIVALPADATLEDLHAKVVETKLNKIPVFEKSLDDISAWCTRRTFCKSRTRIC